MSLKVIHAVHLSRIEPRLRFLVQTLAIFASDDGRNIRPGIGTLMQALGMTESAVREGLGELVARGVLVRDGHHGHTRRFRFDLECLAHYAPPLDPRRGAHRRAMAERRPGRKTARKPYAPAEGSETNSVLKTLRRGGDNPAPERCEPYAPAAQTLRPGGPDLNDLQDLHDLTAADAAALPKERKDQEDEDERPKGEEQNADDPRFKVYAAIGTTAVQCAVLDGPLDESTVRHHVERLCREQGLTCEPSTVQKATDTALCAYRTAEAEAKTELARLRDRVLSQMSFPSNRRSPDAG
jgi:hypothetical protein